MTHAKIAEKDLQALVEKHLEIWNEKDVNKRLQLMKAVYAPDIEMVDRHFMAHGHEEVNSFVQKLQTQNPDSRFTHPQPISAHHHIARLFWQVGSKEKPDAVTGMDLFIVENDKVKQLYVFVEE